MGKKVLVVEDNELNLKLFQDLLEAHGYDTVKTQDGSLAYDLIKQEKPDLIIMDIQLPQISGLDIIAQVKADSDLKDIPVIAVTAFAMRGDEEKIMDSGCEGYLAKPIAIDSFVKTVSKHLG